MKSFWKVLSAAALVAGLAPYKVEKDEETGKTTYQSLLMRVTTGPGKSEEKKQIDVNLSEGTLVQKVREKAAEREEAHLFTDDLAVNYHEPAAKAEEPAAAEAEAEAAGTEAAEAEIEAMAAQAEADEAQAEAEAAREEADAARDGAEEAKPEEP